MMFHKNIVKSQEQSRYERGPFYKQACATSLLSTGARKNGKLCPNFRSIFSQSDAWPWKDEASPFCRKNNLWVNVSVWGFSAWGLNLTQNRVHSGCLSKVSDWTWTPLLYVRCLCEWDYVNDYLCDFNFTRIFFFRFSMVDLLSLKIIRNR